MRSISRVIRWHPLHLSIMHGRLWNCQFRQYFVFQDLRLRKSNSYLKIKITCSNHIFQICTCRYVVICLYSISHYILRIFSVFIRETITVDIDGGCMTVVETSTYSKRNIHSIDEYLQRNRIRVCHDCVTAMNMTQQIRISFHLYSQYWTIPWGSSVSSDEKSVTYLFPYFHGRKFHIVGQWDDYQNAIK